MTPQEGLWDGAFVSLVAPVWGAFRAPFVSGFSLAEEFCRVDALEQKSVFLGWCGAANAALSARGRQNREIDT